MQKADKIYVSGHQGLVGSALLCKLKADGYCNVITKTFEELDLRRQEQVESFFAAHRPEYVFLAAAKVGGIYANNTYKADFIYDNLMIAANVIHASYKFGVKKLLNLGSSCIYPKNAPQPLKEEYLLTSSLEPTNEPYAIAKIAAIKLCHYYNEQYGTNFISVMPTNLYGQNDNFNLETSHVLPAILRKIYLAKLLQEKDDDAIRKNLIKYPLGFGIIQDWRSSSGQLIQKVLAGLGITTDKVTLWGSGNVFREFLHVDDLAQALLFCMQKVNAKDVDEIINIGTGVDITVKELATMVASELGYSGTVFFDPNYPDGVLKKLLDVSKIQALGWRATIELKNGISDLKRMIREGESIACQIQDGVL